ncbi:MAG: DUF2232 domain-containing protein [Gemmatimonadota bacterium]
MPDQDRSALAPPPRGRPRPWLRATALFGITLVTSVIQPSVLVAVPFLALAATMGMRRFPVLAAALLATVIAVTGGSADGIWYVERGWALLVAGWFTAVTLRRPASPFSRRALVSVAGAAVVVGLLLSVRSGAWGTIEWAVKDRMTHSVGTAMEAWRVLRGGEALPPTLVSAVYQTVEAQASVFPAMLGIASMAGLGVAWWLYVRLSSGEDGGLGPLRDFRFNDHLVWLFIAGLLLVVLRWGDSLARVGANAVVFMGALYALRGAAVIMFLSGGLSLFGYILLGVGLVFVPPLVLTGAMVIGIGDTWLDVRNRVGSEAA